MDTPLQPQSQLFASTNDWIYAQMLVSVQSSIVALLITAPLTKIFNFIADCMYFVIDYMGFKYIEFRSPDDPRAIIDFIITHSSGTEYILIDDKLCPVGQIWGYYCSGDIKYSRAHNGDQAITFNGIIYPWTNKHIAHLLKQHELEKQAKLELEKNIHLSEEQLKHEKSIKSISCPSDMHSDVPVNSIILPYYTMKCQEELLGQISDSFNKIMKQRTLRGARYMNILLTGPPGSGKTTLVNQLVDKLGGILIKCKNMTGVYSLQCLKKTLSMVKILGVKNNYLKDYDLKYERNPTGLPKETPIVILIDEWDSVLSNYVPEVHDDCIQQLMADGYTGDELAKAIENIQEALAQTSRGTCGKAEINEFLDYLTTMDNTITVFISNTSMRQVNKSFLRDGRITHRMELTHITQQDIMLYVEAIGDMLGWKDTASVIADRLGSRTEFPSLATVVQILEFALGPEDAADKIKAHIQNTEKEAAAKGNMEAYMKLAKNGKQVAAAAAAAPVEKEKTT